MTIINDIDYFDSIVQNSSPINLHRKKIGMDYSINAFYNEFKNSSFFSDNKIDFLVKTLMDIQLELLYIEIVDTKHLGDVINSHKLKYSQEDVQQNAELYIKLLSEIQSIVLKSRIIFDRIINFTYYFCTGINIEDKSHNSKTKTFFKALENDINFKPFCFFLNYRKVLEHFDNKFRGPETHKKSTLRSYLINIDKPKTDLLINKILTLYNSVFQNYFVALFEILKNGEVSKTTHNDITERCKDFVMYLEL